MMRFPAGSLSRRRHLRSGLVAAALLLGAVGAPAHLLADEASAAETFRAGKAAYAKGEYRAAALSFEAAFREQPHGAALYNAGQSWLAAAAFPRAADAYAGALRAGNLDASQEADAKAHLAELEAALATVTLTAPPGALVSVAHLERAPAPVVVHLNAGDHEVRADLPDGKSVTQALHATAGGRVQITLQAPAAAPTLVPTTAPTSAPTTGQAPGGSVARALGWTSLGGAVIAGGSVVFLGVSALDARDVFNASQHTDRAAHDRAAELRTWTNVTLGVAGALAALGVVLLVTSSRSAPVAVLPAFQRGAPLQRPGVAVSLGAGGVSLAGKF